MRAYSKKLKEEAMKLSDEVGVQRKTAYRHTEEIKSTVFCYVFVCCNRIGVHMRNLFSLSTSCTGRGQRE